MGNVTVGMPSWLSLASTRNVHTGCDATDNEMVLKGCIKGKGRGGLEEGGKDAEMQQPAGTTCRAGRFTHATALVKRPSGKRLQVQERVAPVKQCIGCDEGVMKRRRVEFFISILVIPHIASGVL